MTSRFVVIGLVAANVLVLTLFFFSTREGTPTNVTTTTDIHKGEHEDFHQHEDIVKVIENINYEPAKDGKIRVISILGTRPEVIKFARLLRHFEKFPNIESILITTGQQREMEEQQMRFFGLKPDLNLDLMKPNQTVTQVTAEVVFLLGKAFAKLRPNLVLVQGDTTTAMAASIAAFYNKVPVGHVEAGLRTMNIYSPFPEEMHRRVIGVVTLFHFAPTDLAASRLVDEGVPKSKIAITGNTGIDSFMWAVEQAPSAKVADLIKKFSLDDANKKTILMTAHRRENFAGMENICLAIREVADNYPNVQVLFPVHLNPNVRAPVNKILKGASNIHLIEPLAYDELVHVMKRAYFIMTDSGGIQEEAVAAGKPLLLIRENTERLEGILAGVVKMVGTSVRPIVTEAKRLISDNEYYKSLTQPAFPYGYGNSSEIITKIILDNVDRLKDGKWVMEMEAAFAKDAQKEVLGGTYKYSWKGESTTSPAPKVNIVYDEEDDVVPKKEDENVKIEYAGRKPTVDSPLCNSFTEALAPRKFESYSDFQLPALTYRQLMNLPSKYVFKDPAFDYTLVVGAWRRPQYIARILDSFAVQTHPPKEIWVSIFASPTEKEYRDVLSEYKAKSKIPVKITIGDPQLSYWGRFQLALQVTTPYVTVLDDDCIPGTKFMQGALHMMNTEQYRGVYGIKGFLRGGYVLTPTAVTLAEVVGGLWTMESQWLKTLFRESPLTWITGEDYQLAYSMRKYLNLPNFVIPYDPSDRETRGVSDDYFGVSNAGDTTLFIHDGRAQARYDIIEYHRLKGNAAPWMPRDRITITVVAETIPQAQRINAVFQKLKQDTSYHTALITSGDMFANRTDMLQAFQITDPKDHGFYDMMLADEMLPRERRVVDLQAEALYAGTQLFEWLRSHVVIGIVSDTKSLVGVATAADNLNIPFISLSPKEGEIPTLTTATEKLIHVLSKKTCLTVECAVQSAQAIVKDTCKWQ